MSERAFHLEDLIVDRPPSSQVVQAIHAICREKRLKPVYIGDLHDYGFRDPHLTYRLHGAQKRGEIVRYQGGYLPAELLPALFDDCGHCGAQNRAAPGFQAAPPSPDSER